MTVPLAVDPRGNALISLTPATADELAVAASHTPCPLALVVLADRSTDDVLYGMNRWRQEYELPGGMVEDGESFDDAARRELREETGIPVSRLDLVGHARFILTDPDREELAAVHFARVSNQRASDSDELHTFVWRTPLSESTLTVSPLDDAIAHWAVDARSGQRAQVRTKPRPTVAPRPGQ